MCEASVTYSVSIAVAMCPTDLYEERQSVFQCFDSQTFIGLQCFSKLYNRHTIPCTIHSCRASFSRRKEILSELIRFSDNRFSFYGIGVRLGLEFGAGGIFF